MKLKQLEYLIKIVECGSITQAAQQLYISQPSLTKAISSLEEEYNIRILLRKARGVELTPQGRDFVRYARGVLSAVEALDINSPGEIPFKARLFIATQQLDFIYPLYLRAYQKRAPQNLYYNLVETDREDVIRQLLNRHVDLGFAVRSRYDAKSAMWISAEKRIEYYPLQSGGCYIAVGPSSPFYNADSVPIEILTHHVQVALDMEEQAKESVWAEYNQYDYFNQKQIIFCNTVAASEQFLLNTTAISFTSPWTTGCYTNPAIHIIPVKEDDQLNELFWVKRIGEPLSPTEGWFIEQVYHHFNTLIPDKVQSIISRALDI